MKKILLAVAVAAASVAMVGCGKSDKSNGSDSVAEESVEEQQIPQDEGMIVERVKELYHTMPPEMYTPEFKSIRDGAESKAINAGNEMGYFDYDMLTNSQDPGEMRSAEIVRLDGYDKAIVKVFGENYGTDGFVIITVKLVDGEYRIDDVEGPDGKSVKEAAQKYINGE